MMKKLLLFILSIGLLTQSVMFPITVSGRIKIFDDSNPANEYNYLISEIASFINICVCLIRENGSSENYPRNYSVDRNGQFYLAIDDVVLHTQSPVRNIHFSTNFEKYEKPSGWRDEKPICSRTINCIDLDRNRNDYNVEVKIVKPVNPTPQQRAANFGRGTTKLGQSPEIAKLYFAESVSGDDLGYAAKVASFLEENGQQEMVCKIFQSIDLESIQDKNTRYKYYMRLANSERSAGLMSEAIRYYTAAQEIYPYNLEPISIAYTIVKEQIQAKGYTDLVLKIDNFPDIRNEFVPIYTKWQIGNKPSLNFPDQNLDSEHWKFTATNIISIQKQ